VASHTADLAVVMARKVRNLIQSPEYARIFPNTKIASDAKAAAQWNTTQGGEYFAIGVGGALAGRGAHLIIADDPLSEQDIKAGNTNSLDTAYEWFSAGLRTRLMPDGKICVLHTRWHQRDLIGRLLKDSAMNEGGDNYEAFEFPAILNEGTDNEKSIWPEQWTIESLQQTRASMHHIMWQWYAQYQQNPTAAEAAIIKRDWIKWWTQEDPPPCDFTVQAFDTALTTKSRSDFSVCHTWGVWFNEDDGTQNAILLNKVKGKYEFPELKKMAHDQYEEWQPDSVIVEAKASGQPLIDEMRRSGIFVQDFSPGKGQDKIARLNAVADMFASGHVWFPETAWAAQTVEEILAFPAGEHDDEVDTMTLALQRIRKGGLLRLTTDHEDNEVFQRARRAAYY
jgi:predicted phage terminase large subunit-like protein